MDTLSDTSRVLLSRLPEIHDLHKLIDLTCTLLRASLYLVDGHGLILEHSDPGQVSCQAWLGAVENGRLSEAHRRAVLAPGVSCNVIRDADCVGDACARLSVPVTFEQDSLPGAVVFFFWDGDAGYDRQCLAMILAGAMANLLGKDPTRRDAISLLRELLHYKPGLRLYFQSALKNSDFASIPGDYRLCVVIPHGACTWEGWNLSGLWTFEYQGNLLILFRETPDQLYARIAPMLEAGDMQACCSAVFDDLLKLRYLYEDTLSAVVFALRDEPEQRFHRCERWMSLVLLRQCRKSLPVEEYYPDFFRRLVEYDEKNRKDYIGTLSAWLDNGRNTNAAAKEIYMHRNTMIQQLEKIQQILNVDLNDHETGFFLQLCIRLYNLR